MKAHKLGIRAALAGQEPADCPFTMGLKREPWLTGYFLTMPHNSFYMVRELNC